MSKIQNENASKIRPIGDRLIVKPAAIADKTEGGIYIPGTVSNGQPIEGEVLATGDGRRSDHNGAIMPMVVEVGDRVLYYKQSGPVVKVSGEEYSIIRETDVLGIVQQ